MGRYKFTAPSATLTSLLSLTGAEVSLGGIEWEQIAAVDWTAEGVAYDFKATGPKAYGGITWTATANWTNCRLTGDSSGVELDSNVTDNFDVDCADLGLDEHGVIVLAQHILDISALTAGQSTGFQNRNTALTSFCRIGVTHSGGAIKTWAVTDPKSGATTETGTESLTQGKLLLSALISDSGAEVRYKVHATTLDYDAHANCTVIDAGEGSAGYMSLVTSLSTDDADTVARTPRRCGVVGVIGTVRLEKSRFLRRIY